MGIRGVAHIAGIFEHPTRHAKDKSVAQLHGEVAAGKAVWLGVHSSSTYLSAQIPCLHRDRFAPVMAKALSGSNSFDDAWWLADEGIIGAAHD